MLMWKFLFLLFLNASNSNGLPAFILDSVIVTGKKKKTYDLYSLPDTIVKLKEYPDGEEVSNIISSINFVFTAKGYGSLSFRGNDAKRLTVLLDGLPISIPYSGIFDISQVPSGFLRSISLFSASSPIISGKDAMGGIISINTPPIRKTREVYFSKGTGNTFKNGVFVGDTGKTFGYVFGYSYERSDGLVLSDNNPYGISGLLPNSYYLRRGILAKTLFRSPAGTFRLNFLYLNNQKGVPREFATTRPKFWRFPVWRKTSIFLRHHWKKINVGLYRDSYFNVLDAYDDSTYTTQNTSYAFHSTYNDYSNGAYIEFTHRLWNWKFTTATSVKEDVHEEQPDYNERWKEMDAFLANFGVRAKKSCGNLTTNVVIEGTYYSQSNRKIFAPQFVGLIGKVHNNTSVSIAMSRRVRFPSLKEMYSTYSGSVYPNPDLRPETSYNFEIQGVFKMPSVTINLSIYQNYLKDMITKIKVDSLYKTVNIKSANILGMESSIKGHVKDITYIVSTSLNSGKSDNQMPLNLIPCSKFSVIVYKPFLMKSTIYIEMIYTGKRQEIEKDGIYTLPPYTITNINIQKRFKNLSLFFKINNLFDTYYEYQRGFPAKGLYTEIGAKLQL